MGHVVVNGNSTVVEDKDDETKCPPEEPSEVTPEKECCEKVINITLHFH
jgi:hypothetical protein